MSFLAPLFLALGLGAAVPLLIHLLRRRTGARVDFPAVRYLARAEEEHSRRLKLRNLLLMLLRVLAVGCIAVAAARPVSGALGRVVGAGHAPAGIAIVLDNSLSTSVIVDGHPVLDGLKAAALRVARQAGLGDRIWLVTADGRTQGGTPAAVASAIASTEALAGAGDVPRAALRAAALARSAGVPDPVAAIVTDAQATTWSAPADLGAVRVVMYAPGTVAPPNRAVTAAAARPVRWTPRGEVTGSVSGTADARASDSTTYRITLGPRTLARGTVAVPGDRAVGGGGSAPGMISVHAAPAERGWVGGSVEIEPDELRGDDARYFALWIGEAPVLAVDTSAGPFLRQAAEALASSQRAVIRGAPAGERLIAVVGADRLTSLPAFIVPPLDPVRLGAANRALERAGVPWRYGAPERGEVTIAGVGAPATGDSAGGGGPPASASIRYPLVPQSGAVADTLARAGGRPWAVSAPSYVLVALPIDPAATSLPLRAVFVPWIGDVVAQRLASSGGGGGGGGAVSGGGSGVLATVPGATLRRPPGVEELEAPDGTMRVLAGPTIDAPTRPGVYFLRRGGARVGALVVNPEPAESDLTRLPMRTLAGRVQARAVTAETDVNAWVSAAYDAHAGRPLDHRVLGIGPSPPDRRRRRDPSRRGGSRRRDGQVAPGRLSPPRWPSRSSSMR